MPLSAVHKGLRSATKTTIRVACGETHLEKTIRDATSNTSWAPPTSLLHTIATASQDVQNASLILQKLWGRLDGCGAERHNSALKTLGLLEFLVRNGSHHLVDSVRTDQRRMDTIRDLAGGHDEKRETIRARATRIVSLLTDSELLYAEREHSRMIRGKIVGVAKPPSLDGLSSEHEVESARLDALRRERFEEVTQRSKRRLEALRLETHRLERERSLADGLTRCVDCQKSSEDPELVVLELDLLGLSDDAYQREGTVDKISDLGCSGRLLPEKFDHGADFEFGDFVKAPPAAELENPAALAAAIEKCKFVDMDATSSDLPSEREPNEWEQIQVALKSCGSRTFKNNANARLGGS